MTLFQIVGLTITTSMVFWSARRVVRPKGLRIWSVMWCAVWIAGAIAIYQPDITRTVAQMLGIQRGADLVAYLTTLTLLVALVRLQSLLRRQDQATTQLVREIAILGAKVNQQQGTNMKSEEGS